jgi:hypothetical protein
MQVASLANSIYDEKMSTREGVDAKALKHSPSSSIVMATHSTSSNIILTKGGNQRGEKYIAYAWHDFKYYHQLMYI